MAASSLLTNLTVCAESITEAAALPVHVLVCINIGTVILGVTVAGGAAEGGPGGEQLHSVLEVTVLKTEFCARGDCAQYPALYKQVASVVMEMHHGCQLIQC